jgi:hypothetical protein
VWGLARFEVIGTADVSTTRLIIRPDRINRLLDETAGISLQVHDRSGQQVARGTHVRVFIKEGSPGMLAHDRVKLVGDRPTGDPERQILGKSADLIVGENGLSQVPESEDPGYRNDTRLYLAAGDDGDGLVTICYEADEASACANDAVEIVSDTLLYLPVLYKVYDVHAKPTYLPPLVAASRAGSMH